MTFKRLILAVLVAGMAIAPVAHAENAPTCADEHLSGADCQGPDVDPLASRCYIKVWVGRAACDLVVPQDYTGTVGISASAWADQGTTPEMDIVVRDKATGTVLNHGHVAGQPAQVDPGAVEASVVKFADDVAHGRTGGALSGAQYYIPDSVEGQVVSGTNSSGAAALPLPAGSEVTCDVTGTHSVLGAATAAAGDTPDASVAGANPGVPRKFNNNFGCVLQTSGSYPPTIAPTTHGCVASQPADPNGATFVDYCEFWGEPTGVPSGVASATTGSWTVTHQGPSGTVVDLSGSGPGAVPFTFTRGVRYTLTVYPDGKGAVTAGSPE